MAAVINPNRGILLAKRVAILIDNMNLEALCRAYGVFKLDMQKFSQMLLDKDEELFRTYVFDALPYVPQVGATPEQVQRRDNKYHYLDKLQYLDKITVDKGEVRPKPTVCRKCGQSFDVPVQKLVDVKLSVRLVQLAWSKSVDKIILMTGDKDIVPAVEAAEHSGTTIRLVYGDEPDQHVFTAKRLIQKCHEKKRLERRDIEYCRLVETQPL